MKKPCCPTCSRSTPVIRYGFYTTKAGKGRRYRCNQCRKTFCSTVNTAYYRLQHRRNTLDEVAALSVEGVSKSVIARVKRIGWNTVDRWLERAALYCRRFNDNKITGLEISELQADEVRTFAGSKDEGVWIFASLDVASCLWPSTVVGRRSYRNTYAVFKDVVGRMRELRFPLIVTDGFEYYEKVVRRLFGIACVYGQVLKMRRNDRVIRVERRQVVGARWRFDEALVESEDSSTLHTSFIERMNPTVRQGTAYLTRRSARDARSRADARQPDRAASFPLQLRSSASSVEAWQRNSNAGDAGGPDDTESFLPRRFPFTHHSGIIIGNVSSVHLPKSRPSRHSRTRAHRPFRGGLTTENVRRTDR